MNPETAVSIHGYAGDVGQIKFMWPYYLHHRCPVLVMSPEDSPITLRDLPGNFGRADVKCLQGGVRAYVGEPSLIRQRIHMELLLQTPFQWFLMNDSDSVCLSPQLPDYLYSEPSVVWSNVVSDEMHPREDGYEFPRLAFQPPYFLHRTAMEKLVQAAPTVAVNPRTPFIDWCMMSWCVKAGLPYRGFPDGCSCPTNNYPPGIECMTDAVRNRGATMLHAIKRREELLIMAGARVHYKRTHPQATRLFR